MASESLEGKAYAMLESSLLTRNIKTSFWMDRNFIGLH